jgi:hypothetical protein
MTFELHLHIVYVFVMREDLHPEAEAPCNNPFHTENIWSVTFFRTFGRGRPPTVAPRSIDLFLCNKFRLQCERRPLAEGPKKHHPFAGIANHSDLWDPMNFGALSIYRSLCHEYFSCYLVVCAVFAILTFFASSSLINFLSFDICATVV